MLNSIYKASEYGLHEREILQEDFKGDLEALISSRGILIEEVDVSDGKTFGIKKGSILVNGELQGRKRKKALVEALGKLQFEHDKKLRKALKYSYQPNEVDFIQSYVRNFLYGNPVRRAVINLGAIAGSIFFFYGTVTYLDPNFIGALASIVAGALAGALAVYMYAEFTMSEMLSQRGRFGLTARLEDGPVPAPPVPAPARAYKQDEAQIILSEAEATEKKILEALESLDTFQADEARKAVRLSIEELKSCAEISRVSKSMIGQTAKTAEFHDAITLQKEEHEALLEKMRYINFSIKHILVGVLKVQRAFTNSSEENIEQLKSAKDGFGYLQSSYEKLDTL